LQQLEVVVARDAEEVADAGLGKTAKLDMTHVDSGGTRRFEFLDPELNTSSVRHPVVGATAAPRGWS
jgi:hypothetical protein